MFANAKIIVIVIVIVTMRGRDGNIVVSYLSEIFLLSAFWFEGQAESAY